MTKPDFLLIPMLVYEHPNLSPTDKVVYAVVYWFEHMRDGICKASNRKIAEIALVDDRTVRIGLERLENAGFIKRDFKDKQRKLRSQIRCLVAFSKRDAEESVPGEEQPALAGIPDTRPETPRQFAQRFFSGDETAFGQIVADILERAPKVPKQALEKEVRKFITYWTEPNGTGTKQLWQMKPTFEVRRRLYNWLGRVAARNPSMRLRAGAGVTL